MISKRFFSSRWSMPAFAMLVAAGLILASGGNSTAANPDYDLVIANGRVMDPETGLDALRNVGITAGKISAISATPLKGKTTIDAKGFVVAPGFIDLHEHGAEPRNYQFQAHDGVTTSLELELGTADISKWYAAREGNSLINFGASIGHIPVRMDVMHDPGTFRSTGDAAHRAATPQELDRIRAEMEKGFREGALAEGMGVNYTPAATHSEIVEMFKIASKYGALQCMCIFATPESKSL